MKRILLAVSALCALAIGTAAPGAAADLRTPSYRSAATVCCDWTGYYVGFNLGAIKDGTSTTETWVWNQVFSPNAIISAFAPFPTIGGLTTPWTTSYHHASTGFLGGLQWGYNWQIGGVVLGLEGDWNWSSEKDTYSTGGTLPSVFTGGAATSAVSVGTSNLGWTSEEKIDWLTTWRARLGWAHNSYIMWYLTGGVAWAKIENNYLLGSNPSVAGGVFGGAGGNALVGIGVATGNFNTTKVGWVLGGGVEASMWKLFGWGDNNWSMKLEYLYVNLGEVDNTIGTTLAPINIVGAVGGVPVPAVGTGTTTFTSNNRVYEQIIRVGINYRFNYAAVTPIK